MTGALRPSKCEIGVEMAPQRENVAGRRLAEMEETARAVFEHQLANFGLSVESIESQNISELDASLSKINELIDHADSFDKVRFRMTAQGGSAIVIKSDAEWSFERSILPYLLERKALIIDRIKTLRPEQQLNELREDVESQVDDPAAREAVFEIINRRFEEERITRETLDREQEQTHLARIEALEREKRLQIEIRERRWAIYRSFLERESMASVIGAFLLITLAVALVISMFTRTPTPTIISSAFLLILGYFFGQTTARGQERSVGRNDEDSP